MAQLNQNSPFQSWVLSDNETFQGAILNNLQKQVIQNQICQVASQKLNLEFDPTNPSKFMQEEASLKGQMQALEYLLTFSAEAEKQFDPGMTQVHIQTPQE